MNDKFKLGDRFLVLKPDTSLPWNFGEDNYDFLTWNVNMNNTVGHVGRYIKYFEKLELQFQGEKAIALSFCDDDKIYYVYFVKNLTHIDSNYAPILDL